MLPPRIELRAEQRGEEVQVEGEGLGRGGGGVKCGKGPRRREKTGEVWGERRCASPGGGVGGEAECSTGETMTCTK